MKTALLFMFLQSSRSARFNVSVQVVASCSVDNQVGSMKCTNVEEQPRVIVRDGWLWIVF